MTQKKGNKDLKTEKSNTGRKSAYDPETFPELAKGYARQGKIDEQIALSLGISKSTFYEYLNKYPEFSEALKEGKRPVNFEVQSSLLKRAHGYSYDEVHEEYETNEKGEEILKSRKVVKKQLPPETNAIKFWLTNRDPENWKEIKVNQITDKHPFEKALELLEDKDEKEDSNEKE